MIPRSFEDWHHCITVKCGIPLTADYIRKRLDALNDPKAYETEKFTKLYGDAYRQQVISWFTRAHELVGTRETVSET